MRIDCFLVGFEVLMAVSMKIAVFWVVALLPDYTVLQPRRQPSSDCFFLMQFSCDICETETEESAESRYVQVSAHIKNDVTAVITGKNTMDCQRTGTK
jgi:hypothetical protein